MKRAILVMLAVGCGKTETPQAKKAPPIPQAEPRPVVPVPAPKLIAPDFVDATNIYADYRENRVGADAKYKGRHVVLTERVEEITLIDGIPAVASRRVYHGGGRFVPGVPSPRPSAPMMYFLVKDKAGPVLLKLKSGDDVRITGVVLGRFDDGIDRGFAGYEFAIRIEVEAIALAKKD